MSEDREEYKTETPMSQSDLEQCVMREELVHKHPGYKLDDFLRDIDATGGWPLNTKFVSFYHSGSNEGRVCKFGNFELRQPFWTTVCCADDYYYRKLSKEAKAIFVDKAKQELINEIRNA